MADLNSQHQARSAGGANNLFALAHLAIMSEEERERSVASCSLRTCSPTLAPTASSAAKQAAESPSAPSNPTPSPPASRRPAKKRAVPSEVVDNATETIAAEESHDKKTPPANSAPVASKKPAKRAKTTKSTSKQRGSGTFKMKANEPSFPVVLMAIMSAPQNKDFITFLSDNESFIIIHPAALAKNVLPIHFEDNVPTYHQFLYLLTIWGFDVIKNPQFPQVNVYRHPMFRKGDWEACLKMTLPKLTDEQAHEAMKRTTSKGVANDHPPQPHSSPRREAVIRGIPSPPTTARSVTPPENLKARMPQLSDASLHQQEYSNLGPKYASMQQNLMYRRLLQQSGVEQRQIVDQASVQQARRQQETSQGHRSLGYPDNFMMNRTMPLDPPRAALQKSSAISTPSIMALSARMGKSLPFSTGFHPRSSQPQPQLQPQRRSVPSQMIATPSDADVQSATKDIVSAAINALRQDERAPVQQTQQEPQIRSRRCTIDTPPANTSRLDALTDIFLEQSMARLSSGPMNMAAAPPRQQVTPPSGSMQHRQRFFQGGADTMMNASMLSRQLPMMSSIGAETLACRGGLMSPQRKVSMLGSLGM
mmetsp:Transcript_31024/g.53023  ORF Transcript_31024/g.53023 Transcript_31024/m.53023 type:complete len:593 (+) Transcript_31024:134-1912(+)|eukprot:CAMPEP_0183726238 /NCGR_PEP_ID=MMETSP0737-20130205/22832_1 /TAXON_ID=385413 /ORGANISM="Thalassiosira miniscula, Strain CCMP1093" /LENGTH=592 /DNA_ID=CAMNT_0025957529 /DNA_START=66 /DNA_END=1844 /DNA_ORIENTATION=-